MTRKLFGSTHFTEPLSKAEELDLAVGVARRRLGVNLRPPHGVLGSERLLSDCRVLRPRVVAEAKPIPTR